MFERVFRDKVFSFTQEKRLFKSPCHILVAVSGGADSMALLHTLLNWPEEGLRISVAHIHHGLRGDFADRDEQFVRDYCSKHNLGLLVYHEDVAGYARNNGLSVEEAGRRIRYKRFEEARVSLGADLIATAHTASDRLETTLMRIIRGTGTDGLSGIPEARDCIIRPLLTCTRADVEQYCEICQIPYMTDESNEDMAYTRNRIRHQVLPLLREINPSVDEALLRLADQAANDSEWLVNTARQRLTGARCPFGYNAEAICIEPFPIGCRMIMLMIRDVAVPTIDRQHILAAYKALADKKGDVMLPGGYVFRVSQGVASVHYCDGDAVPMPVWLTEGTTAGWFGDVYYNVEVSDVSSGIVYNLFSNKVIDYDRIEGSLQIRCRREGDVIHPVNRGVGKSLKKMMNECGVPTFVRDAYPILCDDRGVVMVPGYAVDERVKVTDNTKHLLVWKSGEQAR